MVREFSEAEIVQINQIFQEFKDATCPINSIMNKLDVKRPKNQIIDKMLELGLIRDRKELLKKKSKNSNKCTQRNYHYFKNNKKILFHYLFSYQKSKPVE